MSTQTVAQAVGRSPRWVMMARNAYIRAGGMEKKETKKIRNHAHMSHEEEKVFLLLLSKKR
jgi:hypothetical protein